MIGNTPVRGVAPLLVLTPPVMAVSPATVGVLVPLYALIWLISGPQRRHWVMVLRDPLSVLLIGVCALGALSSLWAIDPALARTKALKFALVVLPPLWMALTVGRCGVVWLHAARALVTGVAVAAVLLAVQTFGDVVLRDLLLGKITPNAGIKTNVPGAALVLILFLLPVTRGAGRTTGIIAALSALTIAISAGAGDGDAPRLAGGVGVLAYALGWRHPRMLAGVIAAAMIGVHLMVPWLHVLRVWEDAEGSVRHRVDLWQQAGERFAERPWLGHGFSNSGVLPPLEGTMPLTGLPRVFPLYPHNILMQLQVELGMAGVLLFYAVLGWVLMLILRSHARPLAPVLAMMASALAVWCVGYPLWRSTWVAWVLLCGIAVPAMVVSKAGDAAPGVRR